MIEKLSPNLLKQVNILDINTKCLDCIIYCNDFFKTKFYLSKICGIKEINKLPFLNALGVKIKCQNLTRIANLNCVKYITQNIRVNTLINVAKKVANVRVLDTKNKSNFTCAVIDTGVYPHIDFMLNKNRILKFVDLVNNKKMPYDDNGHGTAVCSLLAGNGIASGKNYEGIDANCQLIVIKALDKDGETGAINILKAMQWIIDNKRKYNIKVVCMSFGSSVLENNDPLILGAEVLWDSGIVVVSACGNSGPEKSSIKSPGASKRIITVGALDDNRDENGNYDENNFKVADFSSRGPIFNYFKPDLITSGVNLHCCLNFKNNKFYTTLSGTSVATPIIAGVCSLILKNNPNYSPDQVKRYLLKNCNKITGNKNIEGAGWLKIKS